ncbi:Wzz/FepE/Etk N-terminal domain-containing protein [Paenibacillus periandrae]|uniref:Wzz/FepE/Etk N-terminal domain-containing protein n=1 Tax=Paenibacillus periandrae TaxID=1761741 RepID=UPI001F08C009|nr:Wzz/FepE/Etk N-terminal domain-containing protein [Paenibacillus periandrae]
MNEDINVQEIWMTLWKGKMICILCVALSIILTGLASWFMFKPTLITSVTIHVNKSVTNDSAALAGLVEQFKSAFFIERVLKKINNPQLTINKLQNNINFEVLSEPDTIKLIVRGTDPQEIVDYANTASIEMATMIDIYTRQNRIIFLKERISEIDRVLISGHEDQTRRAVVEEEKKEINNSITVLDKDIALLEANRLNNPVADTFKIFPNFIYYIYISPAIKVSSLGGPQIAVNMLFMSVITAIASMLGLLIRNSGKLITFKHT